jgi:hypothetical protein
MDEMRWCYVNDISPLWGFVVLCSFTVGDAHRYYIAPRWGWAMMCWECENSITK